MKLLAISIFLLFFRYCLAPHFACPKDRPFLWNTKKCGTFSDICIKNMSDDCEFGIKACEQCPLSNFSSTILYQMFRKIYLNEEHMKNVTNGILIINKNCSQTTNERKPVQECSTNGVLLTILIIVSLLLILAILILLYLLYQCIRARKKEDHEPNDIILLTLKMEIDLIMKKLKKIEENQYKSIIKSLEEISENQKNPTRFLQEIPEKEIDLIMNKLEKIEGSQKKSENRILNRIKENHNDSIKRSLHKITENQNYWITKSFDEMTKSTSIINNYP